MFQQFGVIARLVLIGGDDQAARIGHTGGAQLSQPGVGGNEHLRHPVARGVQGGAPGPSGVFGAERLTQAGGVLVAGAVTPVRLTGVGEEDHGPHHAVGERLGVTVGVIGARLLESGFIGLIGDERNLGIVAAEGRTGQRESSGRIPEGLLDRLTPALRITGVVDLVHDHQRAPVRGAHPMLERMRGHLRIGHHHTVVVRGGRAGRIGEVGVELNAHPRRRPGPLMLEVLGRRDDRHLIDGAVGQQFRRHTQRESRLTGARGGNRKKIARLARQIFGESPALPST